jgi:hypothetical protein
MTTMQLDQPATLATDAFRLGLLTWESRSSGAPHAHWSSDARVSLADIDECECMQRTFFPGTELFSICGRISAVQE